MYNHHLKAFIKAAQLKSFSKAAKALYISTPSLIQQINIFEDEIGVRLFVRTRRGIELTEAGEYLYSKALQIIELSDDALNRAKVIQQATWNTLRLVVSVNTQPKHLQHAISIMLANNPSLNIKIIPYEDIKKGKNALDNMGEEFDAFEGIYLSKIYSDKCKFYKLFDTPIGVLVPKNHEFARYKNITLSDLNHREVFMASPGRSEHYDNLRKDIIDNCDDVKIIDADHYDMNTVITSSIRNQLIITPKELKNIYPNLRFVVINPKYTIPYGIMYQDTNKDVLEKLITILKDQHE